MQISRLTHHDNRQAAQIWNLFQAAYEIEAQVLGLQNFPPLNRTIHQIQKAKTTFYGCCSNTRLVAAMEIDWCNKSTFHIDSFGVSPKHFRQGFGSKLLTGVLDELEWQQVTVATAVANAPARHLYQKHGFYPQKYWLTADNISMVTLLLEKSRL